MSLAFDNTRISLKQARVRKLIVRDPSLSRLTPLKRKVGYGDEEMSSARAKLARMDLDVEEDGSSHVDDVQENVPASGTVLLSPRSKDARLD